MQEMILIVLIIAGFVVVRYISSPTFKGATGERRVNARLNLDLSNEDYTIMNDITLPVSGGTTQIDHVVISQNGIFVIETKNMTGWIFGGADQSRWTQTIRRHKSQFQNPLRQTINISKPARPLGVE